MKKEQIIKSMLFLIIPLFAISCDGNGFMEYEETALMQRDAQQGLLSDGASDNICMVNLNLFTKPYFDYQYNTGKHVDECFVYIDNQEDLTGRLSLRATLAVTFTVSKLLHSFTPKAMIPSAILRISFALASVVTIFP